MIHYSPERTSGCLNIACCFNWNKACWYPWSCTHLYTIFIILFHLSALDSIKLLCVDNRYWTHNEHIVLSHLRDCFCHVVPFLHQLLHLHPSLWATPKETLVHAADDCTASCNAPFQHQRVFFPQEPRCLTAAARFSFCNTPKSAAVLFSLTQWFIVPLSSKTLLSCKTFQISMHIIYYKLFNVFSDTNLKSSSEAS